MRLRLSGVSILVGLSFALLGTPDATSDPDQAAIDAFVDGAPEPITEIADPPPTDVQPAPPEHEPGTMYPADEGAWTWDDLNEKERAQIERAQDWAENQNGYDVHNAFSAAVATTSNLRRVEQAQIASGLDGIETLGVVP